MKLKKSTAAVLALGALALACGGSEPPAKAPAAPPPADESRDESGIVMSSEIGGLNEDAVISAFSSSTNSLERCFRKGVDRLEYLGGEANFLIKIDQSGSIVVARLETSTLGDRATEKCMLKALKSQTWPKPIGGRIGIASKSFAFDPASDGRPAAELREDFAADVVHRGQFTEAAGSCGFSTEGRFKGTAYIATDGRVMAASVTPPDDAGEEAVDCLADVIEASQFPSPGSWPGKVTFTF